MAIGDDFARSYSAGRAIGNDFASARFARRAEKIRDQYQQQAAAEGKTLEDYLPQLEQDLRQLAIDSGATRRNVRGDDGQTLDQGYAAGLYRDVGRQGERRAGALAMGGDQAGARRARAGTQYALGNFDEGQGQQIAGDTIRATQGALRPDGTYDMAGGAQALAGVGARYGNAEAAAGQQQAAVTFRLQQARAKADSLFNMAQNPKAFSADQFAGAWAGLKESVPELENVELRKGDDNILYLYTGGQATGSFDPDNQTDVAELASLMGQFTKDPGASLQGYMQLRLKNIEEEKARGNKISDDYRAARIDVVKNLTDKGLPADLAEKIVTAQEKVQSGSGGWQLQDIGSEPGTFLMQKNGKVYTVKTNVAADPAKGETGGTLQVFDGSGKPVPATELNRGDVSTLRSSLVDLAGAVASSNYRLKVGVLRDQLRVLNELERQDRGGAPAQSSGGKSSRGDRNNNPGNIEDRGQFEGQEGYLGSDGRFARFSSREQGVAAQHKQLERYMDGKTTGKPLRTVADIIQTWSPQSDPTNQAGSTNNYVRYVASRLGIEPTRPLGKEDIPRLAEAMAEFESGNTQRGALSTTPGTRVAQSAPAAQTALPRAPAPAARAPARRTAGISADYVRGAAQDLQGLRAEYDQKRSALERFNRDYPSDAQATMGSMQAGALPTVNRRYQDPQVQRVGERLAQDVAQAEERLRAATQELRANTSALRRQTTSRQAEKSEQDLYAQYGGAADFFRAAQ